MRTLLITLFVLFSLMANAQMGQLTWQNGICEYIGTYDMTKYSKRVLNDSYELLYSGYGHFSTNATADKPSEIETMNANGLEKEYGEKLTRLRELKLLKHPFMDSLRNAYIKELKEIYNLKKNYNIST